MEKKVIVPTDGQTDRPITLSTPHYICMYVITVYNYHQVDVSSCKKMPYASIQNTQKIPRTNPVLMYIINIFLLSLMFEFENKNRLYYHQLCLTNYNP